MSPALGKKESTVIIQARYWLIGEQLCWKQPGGLGRQQAGHKSAVCPGSKAGQQYPGLYHTSTQSVFNGKGLSPSAQHLLDCMWILCPVLAAPIQETLINSSESMGGPPSWSEAGTLTWGTGWGNWAPSAGIRDSLGVTSITTPFRTHGQVMEPSYSQWCMVGGWKTTDISWNKRCIKIFFSMKLVREWNRLSREVVWSPFLHVFKT